MLILLMLAPVVSAQTDIYKILETPFYDPDSVGVDQCGVTSNYPGSGPIYGPYFPQVSDINALIASIKKYIESTGLNSPLDAYAADIVNFGKQYNVNPALLVGVGYKETRLGTVAPGTPPQYDFWGDLNDSHKPVSFSDYPSAIEAYYKNLRTNSAYAKVWAEGDAASIDEIITIATPPGIDGNQTAEYIAAVKDIMHKILDGLVTSSTSNTAPATGAQAGQLDLSQVVKDYGLQSVEVKQVGGAVVGSVNESTPPASPASVMKLIVADAFLSTNPDLSKSWTVKSSELSNEGDSWSVGTKVSLQTVLTETLNINSSNEGANILMDSIGGPSATNKIAQSLGYSQTDIVTYYHSPPKGQNKTTVTDLTKAIEKIYTASGAGYQVAKAALKENYFNINPAPEAAKWGMNGQVTGNSGVFDVSGTKYIITLYINQTGKNTEIKGATEDILKLLGSNPSGITSDASTCPGATSGNVIQTILKYAWPQPHTPAVQPTPAYLEATKAAAAAGKYTGSSGGGYPGIDCGAFVTRVMQDSGADPTYGGGGNTITQIEYLNNHSSMYQKVTFNSISDLQPGDIAINTVHTFIYVGQLAGFSGNIASASEGTTAPAADTASTSYLKEFTFYRLVKNG